MVLQLPATKTGLKLERNTRGQWLWNKIIEQQLCMSFNVSANVKGCVVKEFMRTYIINISIMGIPS
jgi:hypothetical protein